MSSDVLVSHAMNERRAAVRKRVLYGAIAATPANERHECLVKNWSDLGARIEFRHQAPLTDDVALTVTHTGLCYRARVVWRQENVVGLAFTSAPAGAYIPKDALDNEIRDTKEAARLLTKVVEGVLVGESDAVAGT